jgi:hypothetical protein
MTLIFDNGRTVLVLGRRRGQGPHQGIKGELEA